MKNTIPVKRPVRFFNTICPCNPWEHYMLPPEIRLIGSQLHRYIGDKLYWVLHVPKQTGKTDYLVIFDRRAVAKTKSWDERITWNEENGIVIVGC